ILGLYPRKGALAPGSDADIAIVDPSIRKTLAKDDFHVSDYSPWEGWSIQGWPVTTILRGHVVVENRRMVSDRRDGKLVPRKISPEVLRRAACGDPRGRTVSDLTTDLVAIGRLWACSSHEPVRSPSWERLT